MASAAVSARAPAYPERPIRLVPARIVGTLSREVALGLADPGTSARIAELGCTPLALGPAAFGAFLSADTAKWAKVVRASGARPE